MKHLESWLDFQKYCEKDYRHLANYDKILFYVSELTKRIKELEEREKKLMGYFKKAVTSARFFCKHADCKRDSWSCKCDFCKNDLPSIDLNNCEKFLRELETKDKE